MLLTDYNNLIKNIKFRKDRYLKDLAYKIQNQYTDVSIYECLEFEIWPGGIDMEKVINEPGNHANMFSVIGLYDVKLGDKLINDHIQGPTLTKNAIIAKVDDQYHISDVTVIKNDKKDKIKLTLKNLGQNLLDVLKTKEDNTFERAELIHKICNNNDIDIYNDILELNIKAMIKQVILTDIYSLYQKTLDTTIQFNKISPKLSVDEDGVNVVMTDNYTADLVSTNRKAKKLLYKIAKNLEKDNKMPTGKYIQKYREVHNAFVERERIEAQEEQEQNEKILTR